MFQSSKTRLRAWLELVDDFLGDPPDDAQPDLEPWATHPHRRPLRWERERRAGGVQAPPARCLCPVRSTAGGDRSEVMRQP
jgi:hypothetical protein